MQCNSLIHAFACKKRNTGNVTLFWSSYHDRGVNQWTNKIIMMIMMMSLMWGRTYEPYRDQLSSNITIITAFITFHFPDQQLRRENYSFMKFTGKYIINYEYLLWQLCVGKSKLSSSPFNVNCCCLQRRNFFFRF